MSGDTLIIGAGQAGSYAALALRKAGYIGAITLIGDETELPYERPPLSKELLTRDEAPNATYFHPPARYSENEIGLLCGVKVEAIQTRSRTISLEDGRTLPYTNLLLATGSRPRRIAVPGGDDHILYLRTIDDARVLRDRLRPQIQVVCIGAGVIGLEIASSATARGCAVTVIEAGAHPMARSLRPEVADWLTSWHKRHGVKFLFETFVAEVTADGVVTHDGTLIPADVVVAGIGIERNTELAAAADIKVSDGILVDEFGRSSAEGIYAAGDVAAFWSRQYGQYVRQENWQHAQDHGVAVGRSLAGEGGAYDCIPWFWSDQHGINLQITGRTDNSTSTVIRGTLGNDAPFSVWAFDEQNRLIGVIGIDAPKDVRAGKALIRSGKYVDPASLGDVSTTLQALVRSAA